MKAGLSMLRTAAATAALGLCALATAAPGGADGNRQAGACKGTVYLTFDTGSMSQAQLIADTLRRHRIHATFFLANEKTIHGDSTLDDGWAPYWKSLAADGHAFGTHTFDHVYYKGEVGSKNGGAGKVRFRPQFGEQGGRNVVWGEPEFCAELKHSAERFKAMTGQPMDPLWRAPGGHVSATTEAWAKQCGFAHVAWAPAGFLGDELPSERYPNDALLQKALSDLRDGDITMAHLGIWSRKDPWAPADLEPLITGLERKGFCFATLRDHPQYKAWFAAHSAKPAAAR